MQIVIEIDDVAFQGVLRLVSAGEGSASDVAIASGTPLPKNHGRLIDADALYENTEICHSDEDGYACVRWKEINDAPTIIEADKEDADGK